MRENGTVRARDALASGLGREADHVRIDDQTPHVVLSRPTPPGQE